MATPRKWNFWIAGCGLAFWLFSSLGCGPAAQNQTLHKTRLSIPPDPKQSRLDDRQMEEIFNKALSTGIQLGYRVVYANPDQGLLSLAKEVSPEHVPVNLNVEIQKEAERTAYAEIILQCPRRVDDSQLIEFKNALAAKFKKRELPPTAETPPPPAAPPERAAAKPDPAKTEQKVGPEKAPAVIQAIASKNARVRAEPNTSGRIIVIFQNPTKVQKLGQTGDWVKVKLPSGEIGWVYRNLIKEEKTRG